MKRLTLLLALLLLLALATTAFALAPPPGLEINWWVMGGGGGPHANSGLQLNGTVGQAAIGHTSAGQLALDWGYWPEQPDRIFQPIMLK